MVIFAALAIILVLAADPPTAEIGNGQIKANLYLSDHVTGNRPLSNIAVWSIRTFTAVEPYISLSIEPGKEFTWNLNYEYYTLPRADR